MKPSPLAKVLDYLRRTLAAGEMERLGDSVLLEDFVRQQDEGAFTALVQRHGPMVLSVCQRVLGDVHSAEDAFQATFLVLVRRAASIRRQAPLANWLYGVAQRVALKARAKAATRQARLRELSDMPRTESLDELTWQELRPVLDEEIGRLPDKCRAPIVLCYFEGKSHEGAAKELGCPKSTLTRRLTRGRELLRRRLVQRGINLSTAALTTALAEKTAGTAVGAILTLNTAKAAMSFAAGKTVAETILSARAIALAEEVMKGMIIATKAKLVLAVLACSLAVGGAGLAGYRGWVESGDGDGTMAPKSAPILLAQEKPVDQPKKSAPPAVDLYGDPLPAGAVSRLGTLRWRHAASHAAFLPDGKTVLSANADTIRIWEYPSGKELRRIGPPVAPADIRQPLWADPILSQDGKTLAASTTNDVHLVDVATGRELQILNLSKASDIRKLAFSPDGQRLAVLQGSAKHEIRIWDWANAKELRRFTLPRGEGGAWGGSLNTLLWSPDGTALATTKQDAFREPGGVKIQSATGFIQLWDPATGQELKTVPIPDQLIWPWQLVFSPDSKRLALTTTSQTNSIVVVDIATGTPRIWKHNFPASSPFPLLLFGRDSTKLYGCGSYAKHVYRDKQQAEPIWTDYYRVVVQWDAATGKEQNKIERFDRRFVRSAGWSPDGKVLVLAGGDYSLEFLDVAAGTWVGSDAGWALPVSALQFMPDGKHLFGVFDSLIYKWDATSGKQDGEYSVDMRDGVISKRDAIKGQWDVIKSSQPGSPATLSPEFQARWTEFSALGWTLSDADGKSIGPLPGVSPGGLMLFSPDGKMMAQRPASAEKNSLTLYEVPTGKVLHTRAVAPLGGAGVGGLDVKGGEWEGGAGLAVDVVRCLMFFSPDSKLLAASKDAKTLGVWDTSSGTLDTSIELPKTNVVNSGAFSPDGRCVALNQDDGTLILYELASGKVRRIYGSAVAGKRLSTSFPSGPGPSSVPPLQTLVLFSKDGRLLIHAGPDQIVHVWEVTGGKELAAFRGHSGAINSLALSPDGRTLASASADTTVLLWDVRKIVRELLK